MKTLCISIFVFLFSFSSFAQFEAGAYYRLKTQFRGVNECLEGNQINGSTKGGNTFMDQCQNVSGQLWKVVDQGNGYYRLQTMLGGKAHSLEGNQVKSTYMNGAAFMDKTQNVSGQLWKIESAGNGFYRLKNQFRGEGECLEGNQFNGSAKNGSAFMDRCQNVSGQLWQFVKVDLSQTNTLKTGESLATGQKLHSANGTYYLIMQTDGNLCIYRTKDNGFEWCTMAHGFSGATLKMQDDGNLVVYAGNGQAKWSSETHPYFNSKFRDPNNKPVKLVLENNGNLSLYTAAGKSVWSNK